MLLDWAWLSRLKSSRVGVEDVASRLTTTFCPLPSQMNASIGLILYP